MTNPPHSGRPPRFTFDDAVREALDLGIADFTMSQVARSLGVTTPALYRRFPSREDLVAACLTAIGREQQDPPENLTWRGNLLFLADRLWTTLLRHPGLDYVMSTFPRSLRDALDPTGRMVRGLIVNGFTTSQIIFVTQYITDLAVTTVSQLHRQLSRLSERDAITTMNRNFHRLYLSHVEVLLDSLSSRDPDFPGMTGPIADPEQKDATLR